MSKELSKLFEYKLNKGQKDGLIEKLSEFPVMKNKDGRSKVIGDLENGYPTIKGKIGDKDGLEDSVREIVDKCLQYPAIAIDTLIEIVKRRDVGTLAWHKLIEFEYEVLTPPPVSAGLLPKLKQLLSDQGWDREQVKLYQSLLPKEDPLPAPLTHYEAVLRLFQFPDADAIGFIERVAESANYKLQQQLCDWIKRAKIMPRPGVSKSLPPIDSPYHLLFHIDPDKADNKLYHLQVWRWKSSEDHKLFHATDLPNTLSEIEREILEIVSEERNDRSKNFSVELIVPYDLFCHSTMEWKIAIGQIEGVLFNEHIIAVFRYLNRFNARRKQIQGPAQQELNRKNASQLNLVDWEQKCLRMQQAINEEIEKILFCIHQSEQSDLVNVLNELVKSQGSKGILVCCGLVPHKNALVNDPLWYALNAGTPVALWFRDIGGENTISEQKFRDMLRHQDQPITLGNLVNHVWQCHRKAIENRGDLWHHVAIMHDDYYRVPPA